MASSHWPSKLRYGFICIAYSIDLRIWVGRLLAVISPLQRCDVACSWAYSWAKRTTAIGGRRASIPVHESPASSDPQPAGRRADRHHLAAGVNVERVPPHEVIGMALRQAAAQHLEAGATVAGARHDQFGIDRDSALILDRRDE